MFDLPDNVAQFFEAVMKLSRFGCKSMVEVTDCEFFVRDMFECCCDDTRLNFVPRSFKSF